MSIAGISLMFDGWNSGRNTLVMMNGSVVWLVKKQQTLVPLTTLIFLKVLVPFFNVVFRYSLFIKDQHEQLDCVLRESWIHVITATASILKATALSCPFTDSVANIFINVECLYWEWLGILTAIPIQPSLTEFQTYRYSNIGVQFVSCCYMCLPLLFTNDYQLAKLIKIKRK